MSPRRGSAVAAVRRLALAAVLAAAGLVPAAAGEPPDPDAPHLTTSERFAALMARIEVEQARLRTLEATFVQRRESPLLLAPEESRGRLSYEAPDRVRWDFTSPEAIVILVRGREMVTWYRDLGRVERLRTGRQTDHILKFLGPGSSLETLRRYFTLRVTFPRAAGEPYRLELEPRSGRIARRIRSMRIELDRELLVPIALRYEEPGGEATELRFADLRLGGELPADRFELELPEDVEEEVVDLGG